MAQALVGYYQSVDQEGAAADIDAMADNMLFTSGDIIRVPSGLAYLSGGFLVTNADVITSAQIQTPSLRTLANFDISPLGTSATMNNPPAVAYFPANPLPLTGEESMTFNTNTNHGSAVAINGFVFLQDGPMPPATGEIFTVRCTAAIQSTATTWTSGNITFSQDLPFGTYDIVGIRCISTNGLAARLIFTGGPGWRPGCPFSSEEPSVDDPMFRYGAGGVLGSFNSNSPPTLEVTGGTDAAQVLYLDLIKTG
jgi:hypothetical protein